MPWIWPKMVAWATETTLSKGNKSSRTSLRMTLLVSRETGSTSFMWRQQDTIPLLISVGTMVLSDI
jgi:hypothetical protein